MNYVDLEAELDELDRRIAAAIADRNALTPDEIDTLVFGSPEAAREWAAQWKSRLWSIPHGDQP